jgi:hypothetical protein
MKTLIVIGVLVLAALAIAPTAEARPPPCEPHVDPDHYVAVVCSDPVRACVLVNLDDAVRYCSP